jgi:Ca2+-binding RTX toxin-like protein
MIGGVGDDILDAGDGERDRMFGDGGDDDLYGDYYEDVFDGGSGNDRFFDEFDRQF